MLYAFCRKIGDDAQIDQRFAGGGRLHDGRSGGRSDTGLGDTGALRRSLGGRALQQHIGERDHHQHGKDAADADLQSVHQGIAPRRAGFVSGHRASIGQSASQGKTGNPLARSHSGLYSVDR